ncbi:MAG: hypothetical protein LBR43_02015 [Spiroplasmataceae bacterium]|jgi:hypothetical protein|nr:hypothetical protein [Spiroplasmataceae bacterium]
MEEKKIILLLFPLIINKFDFHSTEKESFFSTKRLKKKLRENNSVQLSSQEISELTEINYDSEIREFIQINSSSKLLLVNYPNSQQQFDSLSVELAKERMKISNIVLLSISNYDLILEIKKEYLICPICEKIYKQEEKFKESGKFICSEDKEYSFLLEDIKRFSDYILESRLKNIELIVKKFLAESKDSVSSIIHLNVDKKEAIFNGEIQQNLLKLIDSL